MVQETFLRYILILILQNNFIFLRFFFSESQKSCCIYYSGDILWPKMSTEMSSAWGLCYILLSRELASGLQVRVISVTVGPGADLGDA